MLPAVLCTDFFFQVLCFHKFTRCTLQRQIKNIKFLPNALARWKTNKWNWNWAESGSGSRSTACFPHFFAFFPTLCSHLQARDIKIHSQYRLCTGDIKPSFKYHFLPPPSLHLWASLLNRLQRTRQSDVQTAGVSKTFQLFVCHPQNLCGRSEAEVIGGQCVASWTPSGYKWSSWE